MRDDNLFLSLVGIEVLAFTPMAPLASRGFNRRWLSALRPFLGSNETSQIDGRDIGRSCLS
jgi:hypothetical protein